MHFLKRYPGVIQSLACVLVGVATVAHAENAVKSVTVGGRIMVDAAGYRSDDTDLSSGTEVRRGRLFATGAIGDDWRFKAQYEFTAAGSAGIQDLYIEYVGRPNLAGRVGQFTEPASLEDTMSSKYTTFMERALPIQALEPAPRRLGVDVRTWGESWQATLGGFGENAGVDETERDGYGGGARVSWAPCHNAGRILHAGLAANYRVPDGTGTMRFRGRPESHVDDTRLVDTGPVTNVDHRVLFGLEAAGTWGPFSLQAEYLAVEVTRDDQAALWLDGYYVTASWILTGETRPYDPATGTFVRLRPAHDAGDGGAGAWELAARLSRVDLDDDLPGGTERNVTVGLNWYVNPYLRIMLNYVNVAADRDGADLDVDIVQCRAQVDF